MLEPGPGWAAMLVEIDRQIDAGGDWSGEARLLRDAIGRRRLGRAGGAAVAAALAAAGLELDGPSPRYESDPVIVRRAGSTALARTIEALLPAIREADRVVPQIACWRDRVVAQLAVRAWRPPAHEEEP